MQRGGHRIRGSAGAALVVVSAALFTDGFLYGMVIPLASRSPAALGGEGALSLLYGGYAVGVLVATPFFGALSDRIGRREPLVWGVLGQAAATLLFAFAPNLTLMVLARVLQGVASSASWAVGLALVAERFPERRAQMLGVAMMGSTGGQVLGPLAGGLLGDWTGYRAAFLIAGGLSLLDVALRFVLLADRPAAGTAGSGLTRLLRDRSVLAAGLVVVMSAGGWAILEPLFPPHLQRTTGASASAVGGLFTLTTLLYGLSSPLVGALCDRRGERPTMAFGLVLMAVSLPLVAFPRSVLWAGAALALVNVAYAFAMNPTLAELARAVDRRGTSDYATVYSVYNIANGIGMIGSNLLAGTVASRAPFLVALLVISVAILACLPVLYVTRPQPSAVPSPPAAPAVKGSTGELP